MARSLSLVAPLLVLALAGCVAGGPADLDAPDPPELREHPVYQCLAAAADRTVPLCDGRYAARSDDVSTLLPTAPVRTVSGDPWAMPRYQPSTVSFDARWGGVRAMTTPLDCGAGCAASTLVRLEADTGAVELALGIPAAELDGIADGTAVQVSLHEGIVVRRSDDGALLFAALEDRAPGFRPGEPVPARSLGPLRLRAAAAPVCHGFLAAARWGCAKLYDVDALEVRSDDAVTRLEPGEELTVATAGGTFLVRHRYGAHRLTIEAEDPACTQCSDTEPALLSYEVVRLP